MGAVNVRGGIPRVFRVTADTTGRRLKLPFPIQYLICRNKGANIGRIYFTEQDFTDGVNYVEIPVTAADAPHGEWQGPVETVGASDHHDLFVQGDGGNAVLELVVFQRRG